MTGKDRGSSSESTGSADGRSPTRGTGAPLDPAGAPTALRLGFARGVAPSKWARRWEEAGGSPLELVPLPVSGRVLPGLDLVLERVAPDERPRGAAAGAGGSQGDAARRAVRLYEESLALVVAADHELADEGVADREALQLVTLLAHPDHAAAWPAPEPWQDSSWAPRDAAAALELVATGLGGILLPLPLARHLVSKREHAVLPLRLDEPLPGTAIWASWDAARDAADVQQLVGILRGRTARSGRKAEFAKDPAPQQPGRSGEPARSGKPGKPEKRKSAPKHSRGAQLAAAKARRRGKR